MSRRTIIITPQEQEAINSVKDSTLVKRFALDERGIIRYALRHVKEIFDAFDTQESEISATKRAVVSLTNRVDEVIDKVVELAKEQRGRPKRANAKATPEEELESGKLICEILDGTVVGNVCQYKKYEVGPSGRAQRPYEVGVALAALTEDTVSDQYFPSKAAYDEASLKM